MAALLPPDARARAAAHVDHQHRADRENQARNHADESTRLHRMREVEVRSFAANREEAIDRHRQAIHGIDRAEEHAFRELHARQGSLTGRLSALLGGRGQQHRAREELAEHFAEQRAAKNRQLAHLHERQDLAEHKARQRHATEHKAMHDRHQHERSEMTTRQAASRERAVNDRVHAAERVKAHEQSRTLEHSFEQARGHQTTRQQFDHAAHPGHSR